MIAVVLATAVVIGPAEGDRPASPAAWRHLLRRGRYDELRERLASPPAGQLDPAQRAWLAAQADWDQGRLDSAQAAVEAALRLRPTDRRLLGFLAEMQMRRGQHPAARQTLDRLLQAHPEDLCGRYWRARLLQAAGQVEAADRIFEGIVRYYSDHSDELTEADDLLMVGLGATEYMLYHARELAAQEALADQLSFILNTLYADALRHESDFWPAAVAGGELLLARYNRPQAEAEFRRALVINPNAAEALLGLARCAWAEHDLQKAETQADAALALNPALVGAWVLKGRVLLARQEYGPADTCVRRALAVNPRDPAARGLRGAIDLVQDRRADFAALEREVLAENPAPADFYLHVGMGCEEHRRFGPAEEAYRRAIALADHRAEPRAHLGLLCLRLGRDAEAGPLLDEAFQRDPFHVRISNLRQLLRHLATYQTVVTPHFRLRLEPRQDGLMAAYATEVLEQAYAELTRQFGFAPAEPTPVDIFDEHRWFSARTAGLPWIATIGASTGKVVAMTSPRALREPFNWVRVLRHELVHVITLQQTDFHIPHWYTEALAVRAEGDARPESWDRLLADHLQAGTLLDLRTLNRAFQRPDSPEQWHLAYAQAAGYADFMVSRFGPASLVRLLEAYRRGRRTEEAIPECFHLAVADFERQYRQYLAAAITAGGGAEASASGPASRPRTGSRLQVMTQRAAACQAAGDLDGECQALREIVRLDADRLEPRRRLLDLALFRQDYIEAVRCGRLALEIGLFDPGVHGRLGHAYAGTGDQARALAEYEAAAALDPDSAVWLVEAAGCLKRLGRPDEAIARLRRALELEPARPDARRLLEELRARPAPPGGRQP